MVSIIGWMPFRVGTNQYYGGALFKFEMVQEAMDLNAVEARL